MYAIVRTGGKQYRVEPGDVVRVERLDGEVGTSVTLDDVLLVGGDDGVHVGAPRLESAAVVGTVVEQSRNQKIRVFKYKRRKHYRRTRRTPPVVHGRHGSLIRSGPERGVDEMAHKKGQGSSRNGRDSNSQRLGSEGIRWPEGPGRDDHPPPARHPLEAGPECRPGQGPHIVRPRGGRRPVRGSRLAGPARERAARRELEIIPLPPGAAVADVRRPGQGLRQGR